MMCKWNILSKENKPKKDKLVIIKYPPEAKRIPCIVVWDDGLEWMDGMEWMYFPGEIE